MRVHCSWKRAAALLLAACACASAYADYAALKKAALARKRDVMYYSFGYEPYYWPKNLSFVPENLPKIELDRWLSSPERIDTFVYAPVGSFPAISAKVPSAEHPARQPDTKKSRWMLHVTNRMPDFDKTTTDPLEVVQKWATRNKRELFVALPLNNPEHSDTEPEGPNALWYDYFYSNFKKNNPDCLVSSAKNAPQEAKPDKKGKYHPPHSERLQLDYAKEKVRSLFALQTKEVAEKYAPDGILLDFICSPQGMRRVTLFSSVAWGGIAKPAEIGALTAMLAQIRKDVDAIGAKKNKAILLGVRVPDSVGFSKDFGIDLQAWIDQKLVDFFVFGGHIQLNRWKYCGDLLKKSGIPYWASLDISEIFVGNDTGFAADDDRPTLRRQSPETFRGRILDAAQGGAAGVMMGNPYHWNRYVPNSVAASIPTAKKGDKRYFVSYINGVSPKLWVEGGERHRLVQDLVSGRPVRISTKPTKYTVYVWDDPAELKRIKDPACILTTEASLPSGYTVAASINGKPLKLYKKIAGSQLFDLPPALLKFGANEVTVTASGKNKRGQFPTLGNISIDVIITEAGKAHAAEAGWLKGSKKRKAADK